MTRAALLLVLAAFAAGCGAASADTAPEPAATTPATGPATVGALAPDFTLNDLDGNPVSLSDHRGKTVVVEWYNPDCPFVKYAHGPKGPLRGLAAKHAESGVVWLAVNSGAAGKQGAGAERNRKSVTEYELAHPVLLDESGAVGRQYAAKTTPHMFVVNGDGILVYAGGLDNAPLGNAKGAYTNHVDQALAELAAGNPVGTPSTKPYGCSVKYGS